MPLDVMRPRMLTHAPVDVMRTHRHRSRTPERDTAKRAATRALIWHVPTLVANRRRHSAGALAILGTPQCWGACRAAAVLAPLRRRGAVGCGMEPRDARRSQDERGGGGGGGEALARRAPLGARASVTRAAHVRLTVRPRLCRRRHVRGSRAAGHVRLTRRRGACGRGRASGEGCPHSRATCESAARGSGGRCCQRARGRYRR